MILIIIFVLLISVVPGNAVANSSAKSWNFDVFYDGKNIGEHSFLVTKKLDKTEVSVNASFDINILFFNAYKYRHTNKEIWADQCLESINSKTNDNGTEYRVQGEKKNNILEVNNNQELFQFDTCVKTFSYWDKNIVNSHELLNSQTGKVENIVVTSLGTNTIDSVLGKQSASKYRIQAKTFSIDLWYSVKGEWLALQSTTEDGNILTYKLKENSND